MSDSKKVQVVIELDELIYKVLKDYTPVQSCCTENARLVLAVKEGILLTDDIISRNSLKEKMSRSDVSTREKIEEIIDNEPTIRKEKLK